MNEIECERRLREDVAKICPPSGRMVGSDGHRHAREYLAGRLQEIGVRPYRGSSFGMTYRDDEREFFNLTGVVPCGEGRRPPVLIGAHYDSAIAAPSADDNAAAVAIALAAATQLAGLRLGRDVVVALFDAEEPPYYKDPNMMGSMRFYRDQMHPEGVHAAVIMDLVGHDVRVPIEGADKMRPGISDLICMTGAESHPEMAGLVARQDFGRLVPVATLNSNIDDMSDHFVFRTHGIPYLFLSCGRWEHYHQPSDTPDRLNYTKMARICELLVGLTVALAGAALVRPPATSGIPVECDTVELELRLFRDAFGPLLPTLLAACRLRQLETRDDLDNMARALPRLILPQ